MLNSLVQAEAALAVQQNSPYSSYPVPPPNLFNHVEAQPLSISNNHLGNDMPYNQLLGQGSLAIFNPPGSETASGHHFPMIDTTFSEVQSMPPALEGSNGSGFDMNAASERVGPSLQEQGGAMSARTWTNFNETAIPSSSSPNHEANNALTWNSMHDLWVLLYVFLFGHER